MTPIEDQVLAAERRSADLERRLYRLDSGAGTVQQGHVLALAAGANLYRPPPPWIPVGGPARALYRVTGGCTAGAPLPGAVVRTFFQDIRLDERRTTVDGYAAFQGTEGVPYIWTVTAGGGLRAVSGSYTMPAGGTQITINLVVAPPGRCIAGCPNPVAPPYRITDPLGTFTVSNDVFVSGATAVRPLPTTALYTSTTNPACTAIAAADISLRYNFNPTTRDFSTSYEACVPINPAIGYPIRPGGPFYASFGFTTLTAAIQLASCSPFRWQYSVTGGSHLWGADPATIVLEMA